jgi:formylglycine-generating enzyme required for sulfatase activity
MNSFDFRHLFCFSIWRQFFLTMRLPTTSSLGLAILAGFSLVTPALAVVNIDYVSIGNAGNANDAATGSVYGAVAYAYQIAKNETTISQYAEFLNAVAKTDSYGLYNEGMTTSYINGISRSGSSGSFTYSVNPGSANKPITYVSWFDAARFTNWLHNGQPGGAQDAASTEDGAYTLLGAMSGIIAKNGGAKAWIPSESEWYKAAYYDPNKGGAGVGGYWLHANQSNTMTTNDIGVAGAANYYDANGYATHTGGTSWGITDVGAYGMNSDSAYGTNDQAGNVWEWNDAVISGSSRGLRGGSWGFGDGFLASSSRSSGAPSNVDGYIGFRVASVPEPTSLLLTMLAGGVMLARRKR